MAVLYILHYSFSRDRDWQKRTDFLKWLVAEWPTCYAAFLLDPGILVCPKQPAKFLGASTCIHYLFLSLVSLYFSLSPYHFLTVINLPLLPAATHQLAYYFGQHSMLSCQ